MAKKRQSIKKAKNQTKLLLLFAILFAGVGIYWLSTSFAAKRTTTTTSNCNNTTLPSGVPNLNMTLCDDFILSAVDTDKWEDCSWSQSDACHGNKLTNQQLEWNRLANCSVSNGNLNLNAIRGNYTSAAGITYPWTSCLLATKNIRIQYGYIEEKSKFPPVKGFWPAFWTYQPPGANYNVETDVYEYYSDNKTKLYVTQRQGGGGCILPLSFDPTAAFHLYGAYISPAGTFWYIDGKQVCSTPNTSNNLAAIITNLAVYSTIPPDSTTNQATKQVDYIKVFQ